jgi:1,4-alpha-glucan branching enzyme
MGGAGRRTRYASWWDDDDRPLPDPYSRFKPEGQHGPSEVIDPSTFVWDDADWKGVRLPGQIIYELHIGSFSPRDLGGGRAPAAPPPRPRRHRAAGDAGGRVRGRFRLGYDGVDMFAPYHRYGRPDDFRRFVAQAHRLGLAVILDVVYNHFGPDGTTSTASRPTTSPTRTPSGGGPSTTTAATPRARGRWPPTTPPTGSGSSTWTACVWTPRRRSTTGPRTTW